MDEHPEKNLASAETSEIPRILDQASIDRFVRELGAESDRGVILVSIAILDEISSARLKQQLRHGSNQALTRLLDPPLGAVSGFMSKIDLLFCLGLLNERVYTDVRLLNKLRNACAHEWRRFEITSDIVARYIEPMLVKKALNAANEVNPILWTAETAPRVIVIRTLAALITMLNFEHLGAPPGRAAAKSEDLSASGVGPIKKDAT